MKIITAIATTLMLGTAGLAFAGPAAACGKGGHGGHAQQVMKLDTDGDGRVTKAELAKGLSAKAAEHLARADTNKDGAIDATERAALAAAHPKRAKHQEERVARVDTNKDGRVDGTEMKNAIDQRVTKMMDRMDTNKDGAIDKTELAAMRGHHRHGKQT